ncbi:uncharacterized protein LOC133173707 [Saccostrea echinata]|uniref:uncharacterized protein LOC133173707 n=1 Tax=Saccostrea echinata TaxID=191078 RepID=UPI002A80E51D|nr:uncharacterized protein LOC133173707 [Saccostrea echinata]
MRAFIAVVCLVAAVSARSLQTRGGPDHWTQTWMASEEDVKNAKEGEVKAIRGKLLADVKEFDGALERLLSGKGNKEDEKKAADALEGSVMLTLIDAEKDSIEPMDLDVPDECSRDTVAALDGCEEQFVRIGHCLRGAAKAINDALTSDKSNVEQVSFVKGVIVLLASGAEDIGKLAKSCGYAKKREFEDWAKAGLVSEDDLKNADPAEIERVGKNLREDMDAIENDLDDLLDEGIDGPAAEEVEKHLEGAVALAELHEKQGAGSIPPAKIDIPKGCRKEDFGKDCEENFKRVVGCLKKAVQGMKEAFDSDAPAVKKVSQVKGIVGLVAKATGPIKKLHDACTQKRSLSRFFE